jgi:hypothetical protein
VCREQGSSASVGLTAAGQFPGTASLTAISPESQTSDDVSRGRIAGARLRQGHRSAACDDHVLKALPPPVSWSTAGTKAGSFRSASWTRGRLRCTIAEFENPEPADKTVLPQGSFEDPCWGRDVLGLSRPGLPPPPVTTKPFSSDPAQHHQAAGTGPAARGHRSPRRVREHRRSGLLTQPRNSRSRPSE